MQNRDIVADVMAAKKITAEDVLALRRAIYSDSVAEKGEIDRLFTMDEAADAFDPSWTELFTEAVTDYIVNQVQPHGHVSEDNANWLIARIGRDGVVKTTNELELLVKVLEKAVSSPERLSAYALEQVKHAIVDGDGPMLRGGKLERGHINRDEVELIRRILYAFGGHGNVAITRSEAEVLFEINDATVDADNDPAWSDLFVKAIANFMMAASGYAVPSREQALQSETWVNSSSGGVGDFIGRMAAGGLRGVLSAYRQPEPDAWAARNARADAAIASSIHVTADEAEWLARRMGRDGMLHENEKALLRFIRDEAPSIHPSLKSLIAKAA